MIGIRAWLTTACWGEPLVSACTGFNVCSLVASRRGNPRIVSTGAMAVNGAHRIAEKWAISPALCQFVRMTALTHVRAPLTPPTAAQGEVRFVSPEERSRLRGEAASAGLLYVEVPTPPWIHSSPIGVTQRSRLRDVIDATIESALEAGGAASAGVSGFPDLDQSLSDQLFRARSIGASGLALYVPYLAAAGNLAGALDAEDSAVLRWWIAAASERPVRVLLDTANRRIGAYGPPTRLEMLLDVEPDGSADGRVDKRSGSSPADGDGAPADAEAPPFSARLQALAARVDAALAIATDEELGERLAAPQTRDFVAHEEARSCAEVAVPAKSPVVAIDASKNAGKSLFANRVVPLFPRREVPVASKAPSFAEKGGAFAASLDWRGFANELAVARGPKPLTIIERLFMSRYVPLLEAIARGEADDAARRTAEEWADNFARSYTEGFNALKITGKRPRMVLDAPQLCNQIARLHGAKSTQLVLVDAMRFDLGVRVHDRMCDALTSQATCTERLLLWAALPTNTPTQLELLAHGPEGLSSRPPPNDREDIGVRGRVSATLRRIRLGNRDLLKLDAVEARLRESGPPLLSRLDALADEVATVLAAHARSLSPRTLMFVFGDHGFRLQPGLGGTLDAASGGASPEEVLVPAFAWLIGDVH